MEALLEMVRHVVFLLLIAALISNLFMGTEYKKYLSYATSLIVVVMVCIAMLQIFNREGDWKEYLLQADYRRQAEQTEEEIRLLGGKYEKRVQKQYEDQIKESIAGLCKTKKECCELKMEGQQICMIRVQVEKMPEQVSSLISSLSLCFGVKENNIYIEEAAQ